jgi:ribosomal protein S18 acetylase RimI-like enzyme
LIADVAARAERRGVPAIEVTANPRALEFYRKLGFRDLETVPTRFGPGLRMRLDLHGAGPRRG